MIVSVFVRRLREGRAFDDFVREWEADITIGFVAVTPDELSGWAATASRPGSTDGQIQAWDPAHPLASIASRAGHRRRLAVQRRADP